MDTRQIIDVLRALCANYSFEPVAIFKKSGDHPWPLTAADEADLEAQLSAGDHFLPLPKEPAALANVIEVAIVDFLMEGLDEKVFKATRGGERSYPDLELEVGGEHFAVDVKVARRKVKKKGPPTQTQSRITLYTGNTFFLFPTHKWDAIVRPFGDYKGHIDIIGLYTLDLASPSRVKDFELLVVEPWKIASKERSSTTREYLGAVVDLERLRKEEGDFATAEEFYKYWRAHDWKQGKAIKKQLQKLLAAAAASAAGKP